MDDIWIAFLPIVPIIAIAIYIMVALIFAYQKRKILLAKLDELSSKQEEMKVAKFLDLFNELKLSNKQGNFPGCYIIFNASKNLYYVGQSEYIFIRARQHFGGNGSTDVFVDYYHGDDLTIKFIPLDGSGYNNLNDMERDFIARYRAYHKGYNKTRGNR